KAGADLVEYVPERSRELYERMLAAGQPPEPGRWVLVAAGGAMRSDATAPDGSPPGPSYEMMCQQHPGIPNVRRCLLTHNVGEYGSHANPYVSADICTAANQWNIEHWLDRGDERLYSGIAVSGQLPDEAQAEIRRWAGHPRMSCVIMGGL